MMGRSGTGRPCASTLLVGIWGNVRIRSRSRLFCREAGSFAERSVLLPASCCFAYRDFVFDPSKCGPFGTYFPVSWSGPVVMARDDGGRSARMNYKSGKSRERAKEWPSRRTVTGAPETGAQPPTTPPPSSCGAAAVPPSASLPSSSDPDSGSATGGHLRQKRTAHHRPFV